MRVAKSGRDGMVSGNPNFIGWSVSFILFSNSITGFNVGCRTTFMLYGTTQYLLHV